MWEIRENPAELNQVCVKFCKIQDLLQQVIDQAWVAYEHIDYKGQQNVYEEGEYVSIDRNYSFSTLKIITEDLENPEIVLFQHANFQGRQVGLNTETILKFVHFNDETSSHIVNSDA
ncbi:UNVERIFIED_CONTAM: hypothetical protein FKN15_056323 [Acipenser sinensis]